jgi:hypothetical protein
MSILETLKERSPALIRQLLRRLTGPEAAEIAELYLLAERCGDASFEADIIREDGVNFNPRAARVLQLVLEEPHAGLADLKLALACLNKRSLENFEEFSKQAARLLVFIENEPPNEPADQQLSFSECLVTLAIILDDMRHLHMTTLSETERQARAQILKRRLRWIESHFKLGTFPKIKAKCDTQGMRLSRMFQVPNS